MIDPTRRAAALGALVVLLCPSAARAEGGLSATLATNFNMLLVSAGVLLAIFVLLLLWEMMDRKSTIATIAEATANPSPYQMPPSASEPAEEDDPFRALLQKSSSSSKEEPQGMVTPFRSDSVSDAPAASPMPYMPPTSAPAPPPAPAARPAAEADEEEELSPFQRLAQIGSEEGSTFAPPATPTPPPRPARIELGGPPPPVAKEEGGGDWAALLSKVQGDEPAAAPRTPPPQAAPPPPAPVAPPSAAEEEDPWKKLLGQASGPAPATPAAPAATPGGEEEADPWQALLRKTSGETPAAPATPPAPATEPPGGAARIRLDVTGGAEGPADGSADPNRPRAISLDMKPQSGRPATPPPPPQTEDE